jgi:type I restriction enzyme S subunit
LDDLKVQPSPTVPVDLLEGYRETEIGPLPEEWEVVPLGNVTTKVFGGGTPSTKKVEFWDGPIPWTTTAIIGEEDTYLGDFQRGITEEGLLNSSTQIAPVNSVLLGTRVGVGKAVVTPFEVAVNQDLTVLVPSPAAFPEFLALWMKEPSMQRWFSENKRGTTIKGVPRTDVLGLHLPLPSLPEQRAIAHVLRTVQEAKEVTEKVIEATRELKRSLMNHLFTYGPVPVDEAERVPLKETEIGWIPEHWDIVPIGTLSQVQSGGTPSRKESGFYGGHYPWVKTLDLNEGIVKETQERITEEGFQSIRGRLRPPGTVMVAMYGGAGTIGKSGMLAIPATTNQAVCCIEPNSNTFSSEFLLYYFVYIRPTWMQYAIGTRKDPNISKGVIVKKTIPLPPLPEQYQIARILKAIDSKIAAEGNRKRTLEVLFKALLHNLMTGKVRVTDLDLSKAGELV